MSNQELLRAAREKIQQLREGADFYWEGRAMVFTSDYHQRRGSCCGTGCRHCPYDPPWIKDNQKIRQDCHDVQDSPD